MSDNVKRRRREKKRKFVRYLFIFEQSTKETQKNWLEGRREKLKRKQEQLKKTRLPHNIQLLNEDIRSTLFLFVVCDFVLFFEHLFMLFFIFYFFILFFSEKRY